MACARTPTNPAATSSPHSCADFAKYARIFTAIDTAAGSVVDPRDAVRITAGP